MKLSIKLSTIALSTLLALPMAAQAIPALQLGITGGTYNTTNQSTIAASDVFTLNAYLTLGGGKGQEGKQHETSTASLSDFYYISYAVIPKLAPDTTSVPGTTIKPNIGSISINGLPISVTDALVYGVPPLESNTLHDKGDLADHSIFDTYYGQLKFQFSSSDEIGSFNVEGSASGTDPLAATAAGTGMYYKQIAFNVNGLNAGYGIHFDMYSTTTEITEIKTPTCMQWKLDKDGNPTGKCLVESVTTTTITDTDINDFAPFSHDAQSLLTRDPKDPGTGGEGRVPEPAPLALLGLGLFGLLAARQRRKI